MSAPLAHPLIPDYVKRSSRGRAIALSGLGFVLGEVMSMGVLFNLTKSMSYQNAFTVAALVLGCFAFFFLFTIKEPDMETLRGRAYSRHSERMNNIKRDSVKLIQVQKGS